MCDIPPKVNLPLPRDLKPGFRQHRHAPGQLQFYVSRAEQSCRCTSQAGGGTRIAAAACLASLPAPHLPLPQSASLSELRTRRADISRMQKKNRELHSLRCDMEYKLAIAR